MDLHTPPPSYEAATGIPVGHPLFDSHPATTLPLSPPYDAELNTVSVTAPILKPPYLQSPYIRPYNPTSFPGTRLSPQADALLHQDQYKTDSKICVCFFITLIALVLLMAIFVVMGKKTSTKYTDTKLRTQTIKTIESHDHNDLNWRLWGSRNNDEYDQMKEHRKGPGWNLSN